MRVKKRIDIVLKHIPWKQFLQDTTNLNKDSKILDKLVENVKNNLNIIEKHWKENPDLRLGQLLINEGFIPDYYKLWNIEEDQWLIDNKALSLQDIKFWGSNYDKDMNRLAETKYKLLKDLDDSHISAILDLYEEGMLKIDENYLKYFKTRINEKITKSKFEEIN